MFEDTPLKQDSRCLLKLGLEQSPPNWNSLSSTTQSTEIGFIWLPIRLIWIPVLDTLDDVLLMLNKKLLQLLTSLLSLLQSTLLHLAEEQGVVASYGNNCMSVMVACEEGE